MPVIVSYNIHMTSTPTPYARPETYFFLGVLVLVGTLTFLVFAPFLSTIILSATVAVVIYPAYKKLLKLLGGSKSLASLVTVVLLVAVIIIPFLLITAQIFNETTQTYHQLVSGDDTVSVLLNDAQTKVNAGIERIIPGMTVDIRNYITMGSKWLLQNIGAFFSGTLSVGLHLFLGIFALFYFLRDGKSFVDSFEKSRLLAPEYADILIRKLRLAIQSIIGGKILVAVAQGLAAGIAFWIFGVPNPAFWGTITGLAALVPNLGTAIVIGPAVLYLFAMGHMVSAIGLAVVGVFCIGLLDNFLSPKLIGDKLKIHPLAILFSILGGIAFFGPQGFLLGPLVISLMVVLLEIYRLMVRTDERAHHHE